MTIKCDEYNGICVLSIDGDFSGEAGAAVRRCAVERMEQRQAANFIVDLEKSGFVDSSALEALLWLKRRCDELSGRVRIAGADENCRKILEITRLAQRFDCHQNVESALKAMRGVA